MYNLKTFSLKNFSAVLLRITSFAFAAGFHTILHLNEKAFLSYFTSFERTVSALNSSLLKKGFIKSCPRPKMQCRRRVKDKFKASKYK